MGSATALWCGQAAKQSTRGLQDKLEHKEREDVKNTIMLGLLNSQLDTCREENAGLQNTVQVLGLCWAARRPAPERRL